MAQTLQLLITAGFPLGGVVIGAFLTPVAQLYLEKKREQRASERAKLLIAGELLHIQVILRSASDSKHWPPVEDANAFLPTSSWRENRASVVGNVPEDLWNQLTLAYALLEIDRTRFVMANRLPPERLITANEAEGLKQTSYKLGSLRRKLGGGGGWRDDILDEFMQAHGTADAHEDRP
jgi:hypothetical protein